MSMQADSYSKVEHALGGDSADTQETPLDGDSTRLQLQASIAFYRSSQRHELVGNTQEAAACLGWFV